MLVTAHLRMSVYTFLHTCTRIYRCWRIEHVLQHNPSFANAYYNMGLSLQVSAPPYVWHVCCSVLQCVALCCSALLCVAVCCSLLQCVAVCCRYQLLHARAMMPSLLLHTCDMTSSFARRKIATYMNESRVSYMKLHMGWLRFVGSLK